MAKKETTGSVPAVNRRHFLSGVTAGTALLTAGSLLEASEPRSAGGGVIGPEAGRSGRRARAFKKRLEAATAHRQKPLPRQRTNGDEHLYPDRRASFFKALPQDQLGEVQPHAYDELRAALYAGSLRDLEAVPLAPEADRGLANPLAAHAFEMVGPDSWATRTPPPPKFSSAEQAAEMVEVLWQAITRDVPFREYGTNPMVEAAVEDLNGMQVHMGPIQDGVITPGTLFRGETPLDLAGPYLSQLLWLPTDWGLIHIEQSYVPPVAGEDFGLEHSEWLDMQRGAAPHQSIAFESAGRYIASSRDLGEYVHRDVSYQSYLVGALILSGFGGDALDPANPYLDSPNQGGFVTFGMAELVDLVAKAANAALKAAWFHKWLVHRRLRPEMFAARCEFQMSGAKDYGVHEDLMSCDAASRLLSANGHMRLPLAYPEGSPTHPSYPAGHACLSGACATMLKAVFNEDFVIPEPVEASADGSRLDPWKGDDLTVGGEINKLAANITLGRDAAGVHFRSDGINGMLVGEQVALGILADYSMTRAEPFAGFSLTKFDGTPVRVGAGVIKERPRELKRRHRGEHFNETA